ncbi:hypothetical protein GCE9029_02736 [Grimontia celer]|uniref:Uncharacterized protein n=1 Tax=Grimontia celer TaxID=1796497 RepID=A0A128F4D7_9GAMM|nr:hypothetical protein GCE9029_02736 [Grimontia celer]
MSQLLELHWKISSPINKIKIVLYFISRVPKKNKQQTEEQNEGNAINAYSWLPYP